MSGAFFQEMVYSVFYTKKIILPLDERTGQKNKYKKPFRVSDIMCTFFLFMNNVSGESTYTTKSPMLILSQSIAITGEMVKVEK